MAENTYALIEAVELVKSRVSDLRAHEVGIRSNMDAALTAIGAVPLPAIVESPVIPTPSFTSPGGESGSAPRWSSYAGEPIKLDRGKDFAEKIAGIVAGLNIAGLMDGLPVAPVLPDINMPAPPTMASLTAPNKPNIDTVVVLPDAPAIVMPDLEALEGLNIPTFVFPDLPDFDGVPPTIDFVAPNPNLAWVEPVYASENLTLISAEIRRMLAGGTGLPAPIEQALFGRARDRQAQEASRAVQDVVDTWASRDFSMPPGMLAKSVGAVREKEGLEAAQLNRDILVEAAKWEIENLRFVVGQGMALEQLTTNMFENMAKRGFEAAKFVAESQISLFNAHIGLFNAQNQALQTLATVYRTKLDGILAKLQAYKTAIEAEAAKGQINQQRVEVFKARLQAVQSSVEIFKAMMQGAQVHSDVIKTQFDAYRSEVQAFGEEIGVEKAKFDVYDSQIKGQTAVAGMFGEQVRAYAASVSATSMKADVLAKDASLRIEAVRAGIQGMVAEVEAQKIEADIEVANIRANAESFRAQVDGYAAGERASSSWAEVNSRYADFASRTAIAYGQAKMSAYGMQSTAAIEASKISLEKAKSVGQFTAQMAAGLMSAIHVSAGISGTGSQGDTTSRTETTSRNYNY